MPRAAALTRWVESGSYGMAWFPALVVSRTPGTEHRASTRDATRTIITWQVSVVLTAAPEPGVAEGLARTIAEAKGYAD